LGVASVDVLGADGTVETITGTTIHPVWSVDRQEWVPLAELAQGERLCCDTESFGLCFPSSLSPKASGLVLSVSLSRVSQPVYNIEVHGEHVYQVGELGLVVHNNEVCTLAGRKLTEHAKESLVRHGFSPPFDDVDKVIDGAKWLVKQSDGGAVSIVKQKGRGRLYSIVVEGSQGITTAMKNLTPRELSNLAHNYGFPLPW
jgi:hypothetical protein